MARSAQGNAGRRQAAFPWEAGSALNSWGAPPFLVLPRFVPCCQTGWVTPPLTPGMQVYLATHHHTQVVCALCGAAGMRVLAFQHWQQARQPSAGAPHAPDGCLMPPHPFPSLLLPPGGSEGAAAAGGPRIGSPGAVPGRPGAARPAPGVRCQGSRDGARLVWRGGECVQLLEPSCPFDRQPSLLPCACWQEAQLMAGLHHPHISHLLGVCVYPAALVTGEGCSSPAGQGPRVLRLRRRPRRPPSVAGARPRWRPLPASPTHPPLCAAPDPHCAEYCSRGSLLDVLKRVAASPAALRQLSWAHRLNLALGAAKGVLYLHTRSPPILHRDLKVPARVAGGARCHTAGTAAPLPPR